MNNSTYPKVSIIVPVYNAGERFYKCMDTLINQTLRDIEIILVLDCPTDGTDIIAKDYASTDERIIIVENKTNLHIGNSRNEGMKIARGEYIGFSDHDDYRELTMYEELYQKAIQLNVDIVLGTSVCIGDQDEVMSFPPHLNGKDLREFALRNLLTSGNDVVLTPFATYIHPNIYRRDLLMENSILFVDTNKITPEDTLFQIQTLYFSHEIYYYDKKLYYHIIHSESVGNNLDYKLSESRGNGKDVLYNFLLNNNIFQQYKTFFYQGVKKDFTNNLLDFFALTKDFRLLIHTIRFFKSFPFCKDSFKNSEFSLTRYRFGGKLARKIIFLAMKF